MNVKKLVVYGPGFDRFTSDHLRHISVGTVAEQVGLDFEAVCWGHGKAEEWAHYGFNARKVRGFGAPYEDLASISDGVLCLQRFLGGGTRETLARHALPWLTVDLPSAREAEKVREWLGERPHIETLWVISSHTKPRPAVRFLLEVFGREG